MAAWVILAACGGTTPTETATIPTGPIVRDELVGTYDAIEMLTISGTDTTDVTASGGSLTLVLEGSAQVSGQLNAPGLGPGGADVVADMAGVWTYDPVTRVLRFSQSADTFVGTTQFRPTRTEDSRGILVSGQAGADQFLGTPAIEILLTRRADPP